MSAVISECGTYRYELRRILETPLLCHKPILWVMLNPSTADAEKDDPTIRRCRNFSLAWGHTSMRVGNLYAYRATKPRVLKQKWEDIWEDIIGPKNDTHLLRMASDAHRIVFAWGQGGPDRTRASAVINLLSGHKDRIFVLGYTEGGTPRHPLMMPKDVGPLPFEGISSLKEK